MGDHMEHELVTYSRNSFKVSWLRLQWIKLVGVKSVYIDGDYVATAYRHNGIYYLSSLEENKNER